MGEDAKVLASLLIAAQESSMSKYPSGRLEFELERGFNREDFAAVLNHRPHPLKLRAEVVWRGESAVWKFRRQDPDKTVSPDLRWQADLELAAEEKCLIDGSSLYFYRGDTNVLHVAPASPMPGLLHYLDMRPTSFWLKRKVRSHMGSAPWTEIIGPDVPIASETTRLEMERSGSQIVQTRMREPGALSRTTFDLSLDGNVVEHFVAVVAPHPNKMIHRYDWARDSAGRCVLRNYEFAEHPDGDWAEAESYVRARVLSIDLDYEVRPEELSYESFKALLPPNTQVVDAVEQQTYIINPQQALSPALLDTLVRNLRERGFAKD